MTMRLSTDVHDAAARRGACIVEQDGEWYAGEVRQWRRGGDGWRATVSFFTAYDQAFVKSLPRARVRPLGTPDRVWEPPIQRRPT